MEKVLFDIWMSLEGPLGEDAGRLTTGCSTAGPKPRASESGHGETRRRSASDGIEAAHRAGLLDEFRTTSEN
jgi:hypothetical protein